jgi:parallel beta-helix repeat protein
MKWFALLGLLLFLGLAVAPSINADVITNDIKKQKTTKNILFTEDDIALSRGFIDYKTLEKQRYPQTITHKSIINETSIIPHTPYHVTIPENGPFVPDDYPTIQSAVENSTAGTIITIRNGTYLENVIVDKPLTIQSEHGYQNCRVKHNDVKKPIFTLTNDSITLKGLFIPGKEHTEPNQVGVYFKYANFCQILECKFFESGYNLKLKHSHNNTIANNSIGNYWHIQYWGIWMHTSHNNTIINNNIEECGGAGWGIHVEKSDNNYIAHNDVHHNNYGILLLNAENNTMINNTVRSNHHGGIDLYGSHENTISENTIRSTYWDGIYLEDSHRNHVTNNTLTNDGLYIYAAYNNIITNNTVNTKPLLYFENENSTVINLSCGQIILNTCHHITIYNQNISNIEVGIYFWKSENCTIYNTTVTGNQFEGIVLGYAHNSTIYDCTLIGCWSGIGVFYTRSSTIYENTLFDNRWEGVYLSGSRKNHLHDNNVSFNYNGFTFSNAHYNIITNNEIYKTRSNFVAIDLRKSSNNLIQSNYIHHNAYGIGTGDSYSTNNLILNNTLESNTNAIRLEADSNRIYHNIFIKNSESAREYKKNIWNDSYPSGGNYWDLYNGFDANGDGIGDTPYPIPGNQGMDFYPLMAPKYGQNVPPIKLTIKGQTLGKTGIPHTYTLQAEDPNYDDIYYYIDWGDGTFENWTGPFQTRQSIKVNHTWYKRGKSTITCYAKDPSNAISRMEILEVRMPYSYNTLSNWIQHRFPLLYNLIEAFAIKFNCAWVV